MKKIIKSILTGAVLLSLLTACNIANTEQSVDYSKLEFVQLEQNRIVFDSLSELEEASDIIVVGEIIDDPVTESETVYNEYFEKDFFSNITSYSTIEVKQVLSGDVKVGDKIKIAQYCGVLENQFITFSEMTPMLKGDTWIFFLMPSYDTNDIYWCTGDSDGRYPLKNTTYISTGLTANKDLGVYRRDDFKDNIYNDLIEKYDL